MSKIGDNIKRLRELNKLTQHQVAQYVGKSDNVVSNWENGLNRPDTEVIEKLMALFKVDANELFGWNNEKQMQSDAEELANKLESKLSKLSEQDKELVDNFIQRLLHK
jgi:transcriptional regulator with XRE-family HTH domain